MFMGLFLLWLKRRHNVVEALIVETCCALRRGRHRRTVSRWCYCDQVPTTCYVRNRPLTHPPTHSFSRTSAGGAAAAFETRWPARLAVSRVMPVPQDGSCEPAAAAAAAIERTTAPAGRPSVTDVEYVAARPCSRVTLWPPSPFIQNSLLSLVRFTERRQPSSVHGAVAVVWHGSPLSAVTERLTSSALCSSLTNW